MKLKKPLALKKRKPLKQKALPLHLISIVGPTAIGKTSLSLKVAQKRDCPIISADSRQVYREMTIGTAVPSAEELSRAPHYFIQNKSVEEPYSAGDFEREALKKLDELFRDNDSVVMVGGSGLYVKAVLEGLDDFPTIQPETRKKLNSEFRKKGLPFLQKELREKDPKAFAFIDIENPQRVIRALEIFRESGKKYSFFRSKQRAQRNFNAIKIGLTDDRQKIYDRIEKRVDLMLENGLLKEAKSLYPKKHLNALNTVGYKELFSYLDGEITLEEATAEIKKHTRRFAKRQLTWFRKDPDIQWFQQPVDLAEVFDYIEKALS